MSLKYRKEIDGLRALAVVPVILFHAGSTLFSGGYIGVDVFFVISGYLITSIIIGDLEKERFSIADFYERRVRRILPALFFVLVLLGAAAWFLLLPMELKSFSAGLIAVALYVSNILFWRESGYFSPASEMNPLIHTWSLGVEEQFYIFFPLLLMLCWKYARKHLTAVIVVAAAASLGLSQWASTHASGANFFLLPTRAWELAIGALCALYLRHSKHGESRYSPILAWAGIGMIVASIFVFDARTPFPSVEALLPTVGTALVILHAAARNTPGRLLSLKWMVAVGLVSYSAYLWHQPLFAFARQVSKEPPAAPIFAALTGLTFLMAWLSWAFIERPFRDRTWLSRRKVFGFALAGMAFFVLVGAAGLYSQGAAFRYTAAERTFLAQADYRVSMRDFSYRACFIGNDQSATSLSANGCLPPPDGRPRIVLFGDSEAAHLSYGLRHVFPGHQLVQWSATSCRPFLFPGTTARCRAFVQAFNDKVRPTLAPGDTVILAGNWGVTWEDVGSEPFSAAMTQGLRAFEKTGAKVILFGNAPDFAFQPVQNIFRYGKNAPILADRIPYPDADRIVAGIANSTGSSYFDPAAVVCRKDALQRCLIYDGRNPIFLDANHFSKTGSMMVARRLAENGVIAGDP